MVPSTDRASENEVLETMGLENDPLTQSRDQEQKNCQKVDTSEDQ